MLGVFRSEVLVCNAMSGCSSLLSVEDVTDWRC